MKLSPRLALAVLPALVLAVGGCRQHAWDGECDAVVLNTSQCAVTVFVDGWEAVTVEPDRTRTVDNIGSGRHILESKDPTGRLLERRYIELRGGEDYYWHIDSCAPQ
ncbi:MAG: hypothetical protein PHQ91_14535 [Thermoanaerobaculaceae bacterium]|nr:hypothetical protein [Thermoanaerobaculaceae bacterium]TAM55781.1 MAG: hypothetical protein EPN53_02565 [Acidobacteriota bacterium]